MTIQLIQNSADAFVDLLFRVDKLLTECSGREIISASEMTDKLLDMRQFINERLLEINPDFSMEKIKQQVEQDIKNMSQDDAKKLLRAIFDADKLGLDDENPR